MDLLKTIRSTRSLQVSLAFVTVVSLVCTQLPLFNYVGFEFSAIIALVGSYCAGLAVFKLSRVGGELKPPYPLFRSSLLFSLILLVPPLLIMSLNALRVKNCSWSDGLAFYLLGPVPAAAFSASIAVLTTALTARWRKTLFTLFYIIIIAQILIVTLTTPRIFAFNPILGFFPGITYDESMEIGTRLLYFRFVTLIAAGVIVVLANGARRFRNELTTGRIARPAEMVSLVAGFVVLGMVYFYSDELGFSSSENSIRKELDGVYATDHFTISYPKEKISEDRIKEIAVRHEYYFFIIGGELKTGQSRRIRSFLYSSPHQKGRLTGAAGTNIAKPWLSQLHINAGDIDRALKHELVHVMAAEFGFPLLRIGTNPGLIEGLATAVEGVEYDEPLHRLAAQILSLGSEPNVESLFSLSGFLRSHGGTGYALSGSFCRFLIDRYGIRRFKWLYRTGSFESFYNKGLSELVSEWRGFIERERPTIHQTARAAYLFRRPSIFGKECARVIAGLNEETRSLLRNKCFDEAIESSKRSLELTRTPEAILQHATALVRARRPEEAIRFGEESMRDSAMVHTLLPMYLIVGDAYWSFGDPSQAIRLYEALYTIHLSPAYDEVLGIRLASLSGSAAFASQMMEFVIGEVDDSAKIGWLKQRSTKQDPKLLSYLLGRELMIEGRTDEAREILRQIHPLNVGVLEFFRLRRLGRLNYDLGRFEEAKMYFWESLNQTSKESHRMETQEWIGRCDWMKQQ
ncbi:MAG TPA: hypothetical protein VGA55_00325 [Bacteroidota bacterium]